MSDRGERALERIVNDEVDKDPQFMDKMEYHTYLYNKFVNDVDCSNKFAYRGTAECETLGKHIFAVADGMTARFGLTW